MEALNTQIFLAWCEYRQWNMETGGPGVVQDFIEWRKLMLRYGNLIHLWLSEGLND